MLTDAAQPVGLFRRADCTCRPIVLHDGDLIGSRALFPGHTPPGHTKEAAAFSWTIGFRDTLFAGSVGRTVSGGSAKALYDSITDRILSLPGGAVVYPGHGESTSLSVKRHNPYISML